MRRQNGHRTIHTRPSMACLIDARTIRELSFLLSHFAPVIYNGSTAAPPRGEGNLPNTKTLPKATWVHIPDKAKDHLPSNIEAPICHRRGFGSVMFVAATTCALSLPLLCGAPTAASAQEDVAGFSGTRRSAWWWVARLPEAPISQVACSHATCTITFQDVRASSSRICPEPAACQMTNNLYNSGARDGTVIGAPSQRCSHSSVAVTSSGTLRSHQADLDRQHLSRDQRGVCLAFCAGADARTTQEPRTRPWYRRPWQCRPRTCAAIPRHPGPQVQDRSRISKYSTSEHCDGTR